jgi:hypothetical protein
VFEVRRASCGGEREERDEPDFVAFASIKFHYVIFKRTEVGFSSTKCSTLLVLLFVSTSKVAPIGRREIEFSFSSFPFLPLSLALSLHNNGR